MENQNLEQVFEPDPSSTDYSLGVAVGGHCKRGGRVGPTRLRAHLVAAAPCPTATGRRLLATVSDRCGGGSRACDQLYK